MTRLSTGRRLCHDYAATTGRKGPATSEWWTLSVGLEEGFDRLPATPTLRGEERLQENFQEGITDCVSPPAGGSIEFGLVVPRVDTRGYYVSSPAGIEQVWHGLWFESPPQGETFSLQGVRGRLVFLSPPQGATLPLPLGVSPWVLRTLTNPSPRRGRHIQFR